MDPDQALYEFLSALLRANLDEEDADAREEATEASKNLFVWLSKDGFPPNVAKAVERVMVEMEAAS